MKPSIIDKVATVFFYVMGVSIFMALIAPGTKVIAFVLVVIWVVALIVGGLFFRKKEKDHENL